MARDYAALRNLLSSLKTGLEDEAAQQAYLRACAADRRISDEIAVAFGDPEISWKEMLYNGGYEVFEAETENEVRAYAAEILRTQIRDARWPHWNSNVWWGAVVA